MTKDCTNCYYRKLELHSYPCRECLPLGNGYPKFKPKEPNYGSCREHYMTESGDCSVIEKKTPCIQWDCHLWSNEPAKTKPANAI